MTEQSIPRRFEGRTVLVTGAGTGYGAEIAVRAAQEGARVAVHYRSSAAGAEKTVARIKEVGGRTPTRRWHPLHRALPLSLLILPRTAPDRSRHHHHRGVPVATFRFDTRVAQDPDRVWAVLTDVSMIPQWFPAVREAHFDGTHRHLSTSEGTLKSVVVTKDDALRRFQYRFVEGMPQPIDFHRGTIDVLPDADGSRVVYSQEIVPEALAPVVERAVSEGIAGIARHFAAHS